MKFQTKIFIFFIGACSLLSSTNAECKTPKCFDCNKCNTDCTKLKNDCDSDCAIQVREFLCKMENENCRKVNGCDVKPAVVSIYPYANYDESRPDTKALTIQARKNCCYNLSGVYDNTLSGIKTNGACVQLFDGADCTGTSLKVDKTWKQNCLKWIDCTVRVNAGGVKFNDKASSFQLC